MSAKSAAVTDLRSSRRIADAAPARDRAARNAPATPRRAPAASPAARRQRYSGVSVMAVAAVLTGISLAHLAHGIDATAHTGAADAWCMAVGIDLGFLATEGAALCAAGPAAATVHRWARPMVGALVVLSAAMNAMAFASGAVGWVATAAAAVLGVTIPVLVYGLTRVGFALLIGRGA